MEKEVPFREQVREKLRELRTDLFFDESSLSKTPGRAETSNSPSSGEVSMELSSNLREVQHVAPLTSAEVNDLRQMKSKLDEIFAKLLELAKVSDFRIGRLMESVRRLEEMQAYQKQELARQYAELCGKVSERKIAENKVSDLIERHNLMVNSFEARLNQVKKALSDREMQFLQTKAELDETQKELTRMSRRNL